MKLPVYKKELSYLVRRRDWELGIKINPARRRS